MYPYCFSKIHNQTKVSFHLLLMLAFFDCFVFPCLQYPVRKQTTVLNFSLLVHDHLPGIKRSPFFLKVAAYGYYKKLFWTWCSTNNHKICTRTQFSLPPFSFSLSLRLYVKRCPAFHTLQASGAWDFWVNPNTQANRMMMEMPHPKDTGYGYVIVIWFPLSSYLFSYMFIISFLLFLVVCVCFI